MKNNVLEMLAKMKNNVLEINNRVDKAKNQIHNLKYKEAMYGKF